MTIKEIQNDIDYYKVSTGNDVGELSDGDHSFNDLYDHRAMLTAALIDAFDQLEETPRSGKHFSYYPWKSTLHEDGSFYKDWFIVGWSTPYGPVTYHYPMKYWDLFHCPSLERAPHWDGHTAKDVVERIEKTVSERNRKNKAWK